MSRRDTVVRRALSALLLGPAVLVLAVVLPASSASAHPLDVYVQGSYVTLAPSKVSVELDLSPGVLLAPRVLDVLDVDRDRQISDSEARSYAEQVLHEVEVRADDRLLTVELTSVEVPPYLTVQAGYGTLRVYGEAGGAPTVAGEHQIFFRNGFAPTGSAYQVNAFVENGAPVTLGLQRRDEAQQQSVVNYQIDSAAAGSTAGRTAGGDAAARPSPQNRLLEYVDGPSLSGWAMLFALGAAALLGALHALTPGHAKTLMAAYLVGSGGTARNAVALGAVVTFTHTASVVVIGLIALLASQFLVPGLLVPGLEITAGLLVVALGLRLLRQRWSARGAWTPHHDHDAHRHDNHRHDNHREPHHHEDLDAQDEHAHHVLVHSGASTDGASTDGASTDDGGGHGHGHDARGASVHAHGGRAHTHAIPVEGITPRSLVAMGVSGGLVPCPEALGVMVLAVGVNRIVLGLGLILSFSIGLAAVLMGLGLLLVRSRSLVARLGGFDRFDRR